MRKLLFVLGLICALEFAGCTNHDRSVGVLENEGYTNIEIIGYSWFSCGEEYEYHTRFRATNPRGLNVEGTVCCNLITDCSIHWD